MKERAVNVAPETAAAPVLSIVIPAYNEAARIEATLDRAVELVRQRAFVSELLVVDDGSTDDTAAVVERWIAAHPAAGVELVRLGQNRGKGAALRAGVLRSKGARVLVMDADLATPIEMLDRLWAALDAGSQVAVGSRAVEGAHVQRSQSSLRVWFGRAGNLWIQALAVPGIHDTQCGFKLFEGEWARRLWQLSREDRFGVDVEVLCLARRKFRLRVAEVGVEWLHRDGSKVRVRDYVDVLVKVPLIVWSVLRS